MNPDSRSKDIPLEALRGVASLVVLLWHCTVAFWPAQSGAWREMGPGLRETPIFAFLNGPGWVVFFFVLSGYVLTRRFIMTGDHSILVRGVLKRWPRLAGPVVLATLLSWVLLASGMSRHMEAGAATASPWLLSFAGANTDGRELAPSLLGAIDQGLLTFFRGDYSYNSNLWTMRIEFFGSLLAFAYAAFIHLLRTSLPGLLYATALSLAAAYFINPLYFTFCLGVALAALLPVGSRFIGPMTCVGFVALAIVLMGFTDGAGGIYAIVGTAFPGRTVANYFYALGAVLLIASVEGAAGMRAALTGRVAAWLGEMSFPLYLVHIPVLCSLGCLTFLALPRGLAGAGALASTVLGSFLLAAIFARFNEWWVKRVNRATEAMQRKSGALAPADGLPRILSSSPILTPPGHR
jgi:peptidoglycan/LPS O-acetylase OafA/YrhL